MRLHVPFRKGAFLMFQLLPKFFHIHLILITTHCGRYYSLYFRDEKMKENNLLMDLWH